MDDLTFCTMEDDCFKRIVASFSCSPDLTIAGAGCENGSMLANVTAEVARFTTAGKLAAVQANDCDHLEGLSLQLWCEKALIKSEVFLQPDKTCRTRKSILHLSVDKVKFRVTRRPPQPLTSKRPQSCQT
ncbi:PREDICTED: uncharacterized protein LOC108369324 [Rhagoletis zephyria]|uniref:uncharacterized protein LOC108369324 n=1 Tax=Rhagoletis zephyria TaxID=28612 RepID=UPI00081154F7|nr:PREDICTED: uncharacterized protein LOC108369324 [Rhagoletis zephyria]